MGKLFFLQFHSTAAASTNGGSENTSENREKINSFTLSQTIIQLELMK